METIFYTSNSGVEKEYPVIDRTIKLGSVYFELETPWKPGNTFLARMDRCRPGREAEHYFKIESHDKKETDKEQDQETIQETTGVFEDIRSHPKISFYKHQTRGINFLVNRTKAYLGDDMGLGKTLQTIVASDIVGQDVVIFCPASLQGNWQREILKFSNRDLKHFEVISYSSRQYPDCTGKTVIADEAHYLKNYDTQRSSKFFRCAQQANVVWLLSGTMLTRAGIDAYSPLCILEGRTPSKQGYWQFGYTFCYVQKNKFQTKLVGCKNEQFLKERLDPFFLRRTKRECLDLPDKIRREIYFEVDRNLAGESLDLYRKMFDGLGEAKEQESEAWATVRKKLGIAKVSQAISYIKDSFDELENYPVVIFAHHTVVCETLAEELKAGLIYGRTPIEQRQKLVEQFQAGQLKYLVCNMQSGGTGLTLTTSNHVVFVELDVTPSSIFQAEDRIHRIGQDEKCNIDYLIASESMDVDIYQAVKFKAREIEKVIKQ